MNRNTNWARNHAEGLRRKSSFSGVRGLTSWLYQRAIARGARRGRLDRASHVRCLNGWHHVLNARSKALIWNAYATERLLEAQRQRQRGDFCLARLAVQTARHAIAQRDALAGGPAWGPSHSHGDVACSM